jgi:hypothetical protein
MCLLFRSFLQSLVIGIASWVILTMIAPQAVIVIVVHLPPPLPHAIGVVCHLSSLSMSVNVVVVIAVIVLLVFARRWRQ